MLPGPTWSHAVRKGRGSPEVTQAPHPMGFPAAWRRPSPWRRSSWFGRRNPPKGVVVHAAAAQQQRKRTPCLKDPSCSEMSSTSLVQLPNAWLEEISSRVLARPPPALKHAPVGTRDPRIRSPVLAPMRVAGRPKWSAGVARDAVGIGAAPRRSITALPQRLLHTWHPATRVPAPLSRRCRDGGAPRLDSFCRGEKNSSPAQWRKTARVSTQKLAKLSHVQLQHVASGSGPKVVESWPMRPNPRQVRSNSPQISWKLVQHRSRSATRWPTSVDAERNRGEHRPGVVRQRPIRGRLRQMPWPRNRSSGFPLL